MNSTVKLRKSLGNFIFLSVWKVKKFFFLFRGLGSIWNNFLLNQEKNHGKQNYFYFVIGKQISKNFRNFWEFSILRTYFFLLRLIWTIDEKRDFANIFHFFLALLSLSYWAFFSFLLVCEVCFLKASPSWYFDINSSCNILRKVPYPLHGLSKQKKTASVSKNSQIP